MHPRLTQADDFYPRPPRGGRRAALAARRFSREISTHALREEGDSVILTRGWCHFISTHALREEGDSDDTAQLPYWPNFYPRPPRGGRPMAAAPL